MVVLLSLFTIAIPELKSQIIGDVKKEENKFIYNDEIKLFMGDIIYVEVESDGKKLTEFEKVNTITDSSRTITFRFTYEGFGSDMASYLKVMNPFGKILRYKAKIRTAPWRMYSETSIMPVFRKAFGIELWPYKIESIILYDFTVEELKDKNAK